MEAILNTNFKKQSYPKSAKTKRRIISKDVTPYINDGCGRMFTRHFSALKQTRYIRNEFEAECITLDSCDQVALMLKLNSIKDLRGVFSNINRSFQTGGTLIGFAETAKQTKLNILKKYPAPFNHLVYVFFFAIHRMLPKLSGGTASLYQSMFRNKQRVLSKAEIMGRLVCSGFNILDFTEENGILFFVARKKGIPDTSSATSYWPLFKMKRIGKGGEKIFVYKLRTMHPYSEYLQEYIREHHGLDAGGKFRNDFRITSWGRVFRKYWIDELPMLINLIKGDIKLVGVRPLSEQYFSMYPDDVKELRCKNKPGLIPPFYADMPKTLEEIIESEKRYLEQYQKRKVLTDIKYIFLILQNILLKFARSK